MQNIWARVWLVPAVPQKAHATFSNTALGEIKHLSYKRFREIKVHINISTRSIFTRKDISGFNILSGLNLTFDRLVVYGHSSIASDATLIYVDCI